MCKPVWVQILWSESPRFKEMELIPFLEFEIKAHKIAMKAGYGQGYCKTKVKVLFDNGQSYVCRLDLAIHDVHGFEHHVKKLITWYEKNINKGDSGAQLFTENYVFLKFVKWFNAYKINEGEKNA